MAMFSPQNRTRSPEHQRIYALYELWYTVVDFAAAGAFVLGSILFFSEETKTIATAMYLTGSIFFASKPTIRLLREMRYFKMGDFDTLADHQRSKI